MIELAFVVCMSAFPQNCEKRTLYYSDISPLTCVVGAQPVLAKWVNDHPVWKVAEWSCRAKNRSEQDA